MAELADAQASGACGSNIVRVQVPLPALFFCLTMYHVLISKKIAVFTYSANTAIFSFIFYFSITNASYGRTVICSLISPSG